ncbi:DUF4180 domain-containing protein [Paenibacillus soyae]|uniref:DUF4180 domain-containing protein n=1 Tax=Paenibacillus soyae TaxID=2969249 RepID=A0A9X2SE79_9BACL|nr:DUF4180 domain-containing protein [Paenibacillus soyae]MCR2807922.1 DUF4180 domain-containing protein [Paenibacillus soyae]
MNIKKMDPGPAGEPIAVISGDGIVISDVQSALDLMATVRYETDSYRLVLNKSMIDESFFDLKTRVAGDILQKFINYGVKLAIVGDFSSYTSKSFQDFVYECNKGSHFFFLASEEQAVEKLQSLK